MVGFDFFSLLAAVYFGNLNELSTGIITSGNRAVELCITLLGSFCLWNGIMNVAEKADLTRYISKIMSPVLRKLFKGMKRDDDALLPISLNVTANLMGLSNAATPMGIEAMKRLAENNENKTAASNNMVLFVVMNSAALRIVPSTVANLRANHGSKEPLEILLPSVISSLCALTVGITMTKLTSRFFKNE